MPYGQIAHSETGENKETSVISWSPDHDRWLTFRSQVSLWFWRTAKLEKDRDLRSKPLAGPFRRLRTENTSENKG